jgi:hypothetical protein
MKTLQIIVAAILTLIVFLLPIWLCAGLADHSGFFSR